MVAGGPPKATATGAAAAAESAKPHGAGAGMAHDLVAFCNYAWTPYHAVEEASRRLLAAGVRGNV